MTYNEVYEFVKWLNPTLFVKTKFKDDRELKKMSGRYIEPISNYYELEAADFSSANQLMEIGTLRPHNNNNNNSVVVDTRYQFRQSFLRSEKE